MTTHRISEQDQQEERARALCACPFGIAVHYLAQQSGLSPQDLVSPLTASTLAAHTDGELNAWFDPTPFRLSQAMAIGDQQLPYARAVMAAGAEEWFAPADLTAQLWLSATDETIGGPTSPPMLGRRQPTGAAPLRWELYAQKPNTLLMTSTDLGPGKSAALLALRHSSTDYHLGKEPYIRYRLTFMGEPRLYEVDSAWAWHRLAAHYPARNESGHLTPNWDGVAQEWDGVHFSLGGWLTATYTPVTSDAGTSVFQAWDFEQTLWLNWDIATADRLPDYVERDFPGPNFARLSFDPWFDPEHAGLDIDDET